MFSPELSQHWIAEQDASVDPAALITREEEKLSPSQQEALDALVERVNAARSVV